MSIEFPRYPPRSGRSGLRGLSDITRLLRRVFDRRAQHLGLTRAQWRALHRIERAPGRSQSALAEDLELEAYCDRPRRRSSRTLRLRRAPRRSRRPTALEPVSLAQGQRGGGGNARRGGLCCARTFMACSPDELQHTLDVLERIKSTLVGLDQACREPAHTRQPKRNEKADR